MPQKSLGDCFFCNKSRADALEICVFQFNIPIIPDSRFCLGRAASLSGQTLGFGDVYRSAVVGDIEAKGFAYVNLRDDKRSDELHPSGVLHASDGVHLGENLN